MGIHSPNLLKKICVLQNKAVRIIGGGSYRDHATPFYYKLKILKLPDLYKLETAKVDYRHFQKNLPPLISNLFTKTNEVSTRSTRSSNPYNKTTLYIRRYPTVRLQKCIKYQGVKIWNEIPSHISDKTFTSFKQHLKNYLLNQYQN